VTLKRNKVKDIYTDSYKCMHTQYTYMYGYTVTGSFKATVVNQTL